MNRLRRWTPGKDWTTVLPGRSWYRQDEQWFYAAAVLDGSWGTRRLAGIWHEDEDQVWTVRIPKDAAHEIDIRDLFEDGGKITGPLPVSWKSWESAYCELGDKPHRAIGTGLDDGELVSRMPVPSLEGVRHLNRAGLVRVATPRERRAVRLWERSVRRADENLRRRLRHSRHRLERGEWEKYDHRYRRYQRRRAQADARW
jgi:hypothetical protein